jgi:hypothetical protein
VKLQGKNKEPGEELPQGTVPDFVNFDFLWPVYPVNVCGNERTIAIMHQSVLEIMAGGKVIRKDLSSILRGLAGR